MQTMRQRWYSAQAANAIIYTTNTCNYTKGGGGGRRVLQEQDGAAIKSERINTNK